MAPPQEDVRFRLVVHGALILAFIIFGVGSLIGALGLPATNPLFFTFVREIIAALLMLFVLLPLSLLLLQTRNNNNSSNSSNKNYYYVPQAIHFKSFCRLGLLMFGNQAGYIVGIQLAGPVTASVWQPCTPILTAAMEMLWGLERVSVRRLMGIFVSFFGCTAMVLLNNKSSTGTGGTSTSAYYYLIGNLLFFLNCLCSSSFIIFSKEMLSLYPSSLTVTAWSYYLAAPWMFLAAYLSSVIPTANFWICPECTSGSSSFRIPQDAIPALVYYILFMSVVAWGLIVWANQYVTGTLVVSYAVIQPVTSLLLTTTMLLLGVVASCTDDDEGEEMIDDNNNRSSSSSLPCLNYSPGFGILCGMLGVFCGLLLIVSTEPPPPPRPTPTPTSNSTSNSTTGNVQHRGDEQEDGHAVTTEYGTANLSQRKSSILKRLLGENDV